MSKKGYKTIISNNNNFKLKEVNGYYYTIKDTKLFVYFDYIHRTWFVVDVNIGMSFAQGLTMREAKNSAENNLNKLLSMKDGQRYQKLRFQYQRLLKEIS